MWSSPKAEGLTVGEVAVTKSMLGLSVRLNPIYLIFLVVDSRGNWAICGKSSGVMSMPVPPRNSDGKFSYDTTDTVNVEVMPLVSGYIHFPYIILHRYLRRGSSELGMLSLTT